MEMFKESCILLDFRMTHRPPSKPFLKLKRQQLYPTKIVSGNHQIAAILNSGDVLLWSPTSDPAYTNTSQQEYFPQSKPKKVWSVKKKHLAAIDIAIGIDSTLAVSTSCGLVFIGTRKKETYKFVKKSHLSHITSVFASSSGSYAGSLY
jgi:hypothetical protein